MSQPVLVTGATGFLGGVIARELLAHDYDVHALAREGSDRSALEGLAVTWHTGDVTEPDTLDAAFASVPGEPWLVHGAAVISYRSGDGPLLRAVNVEGTRSVAAAARRRGVGRGVHVSSVVAIGHATGDEALDEYAEWNAGRLGADYVTTKHAAEQVALASCGPLGLRIVNPGAVFGPTGPRSNTSRLVCAVARGELPPLGPPGGMSVVGAADVAAGVRLALERGEAGRRYVLAESYWSVRHLLRRVARTLQAEGFAGREPRGVLPRSLWAAVVAGARALERRRPREHATPQALAVLGCRWRVRADRARGELGWRPRPFDDVLVETVRYLARTGELAR